MNTTKEKQQNQHDVQNREKLVEVKNIKKYFPIKEGS